MITRNYCIIISEDKNISLHFGVCKNFIKIYITITEQFAIENIVVYRYDKHLAPCEI